ncbi:MAG TPA: hypothetical protein VFA59_17345 [Vicinamibacterales bacterium]|nr:hypothetical protein [Vicinamibacterales bacterium]
MHVTHVDEWLTRLHAFNSRVVEDRLSVAHAELEALLAALAKE